MLVGCVLLEANEEHSEQPLRAAPRVCAVRRPAMAGREAVKRDVAVNRDVYLSRGLCRFRGRA